MKRRSGFRSDKLKVIETPSEVRLTAWVQLMRTYLVLQKEVVSIISEYDLTVAQFDVLAALHYGEGRTQQDLASRLLVTKGNVCGLLDRLEQAGWVERRADSADGRVNRLYLTPAGKRRIEAALPAHDAYVAKLLSCLSLDEAATMRGLLQKVEADFRET